MKTPKKQFNKLTAIGNYAEEIVCIILQETYPNCTIFRSHGHAPEYDIAFVKENEKELKTIEVKFDLESRNTGNFFIETKTLSQNKTFWRDSGINSSNSDMYALLTQRYSNDFTEIQVFILPTKILKQLCEDKDEIRGGYQKGQKGYLIKIEDIQDNSYRIDYNIDNKEFKLNNE